jgi:type I restriction enzyme R subunit
MKEYDNFEKDCANSNSSSRILLKQLKDKDCRIIITTIQKLANLMKPTILGKDEVLQEVMKQEVVIIFDECHRSQFGDMQKMIRRSFKKYMMFGFTGTPIFAENAGTSADPKLRTTAQVFGGEPDERGNHTRALHTYTIINAINDQNVLKFKVDYIKTMKMKEDAPSKEVWGIDTNDAWKKPERIKLVAKYILDHFDEKTKQADIYGMSHLKNVAEMVRKGKKAKAVRTQKLQTRGFNSILAVDSIPTAIAYYNELMKQMEEQDESQKRTIAMIYTYAANEAEDETGTLEDENPEGIGQLDGDSRQALDAAIKKYNDTFGTNYSTDGDKFQSYYKDVSLRMKDKQVDILIVVGMFLTGFDAKTLNTLWVDKNLKMHGLLQAFSRTNRILNAVKNCGNIVCFRNLEEATNKCLGLFGDKDASGIVLMRPFDDYYNGYDEMQKNGQMKHYPGYVELVQQLLAKFPLNKLKDLASEKERKEFIKLMGAVLKMQNLLTSFDEFTIDKVMVDEKLDFNEFKMQDYLGWYNSHYEIYKKEKAEQGGKSETIDDEVIYELELVKQVSIGIDFILALVAQYHESNCQDASIRVKIEKALDASPDLKDKKELVERFIERQTPDSNNVLDKWEEYIIEQRKQELEQIISDENLKHDETVRFMQQSFEDEYVTTSGLAVTNILPPMPIFGAGAGKRAEKKKTVIEKLEAFFKKYFNLIESNNI